MLPDSLKNNTYYLSTPQGKKEWQSYLSKIGSFAQSLDKEFLSQICFEHFDRFNDYFPLFDFEKHKVIRIIKSTKEIYENIRYDDNKELDFWYFQVDNFLKYGERKDYDVLKYAIENKSWSFAPVIIENTLANKIGKRSFGKPLHLIEGTHRVSFIKRLYELKLIESETKHELLYITEE